MKSEVLYEKRDDIAITTLNNPEKLNPMSDMVREGLLEALNEAQRDDEVRAVILTGSGKAFSAGADLVGFGHFLDDSARSKAYFKEAIQFMHKVEIFPKPLIAAVNGYAFGGGFELALTCDMIIASQNAVFSSIEAKLGLIPAYGMVRLPQIVGRSKAKEIMMTSDTLSAEEAHRINLVSKVVPSEKLMDESICLAKKIAQHESAAIELIKSVINRDLGEGELAYTGLGISSLFETEIVKKSIREFLQKTNTKV